MQDAPVGGSEDVPSVLSKLQVLQTLAIIPAQSSALVLIEQQQVHLTRQ